LKSSQITQCFGCIGHSDTDNPFFPAHPAGQRIGVVLADDKARNSTIDNVAAKIVGVMNVTFDGYKEVIRGYPARVDGDARENAVDVPAQQISPCCFKDFSGGPWYRLCHAT
jgi:hypothetical protein